MKTVTVLMSQLRKTRQLRLRNTTLKTSAARMSKYGAVQPSVPVRVTVLSNSTAVGAVVAVVAVAVAVASKCMTRCKGFQSNLLTGFREASKPAPRVVFCTMSKASPSRSSAHATRRGDSDYK